MEERYATLDKVSCQRIENIFNDVDFDMSLKDVMDFYLILPNFLFLF